MISIFPSQIVDYIDNSFQRNWFDRGQFSLGAEDAVCVASGLLDLLDRVPEHLITLRPEDAAAHLSQTSLA